MWVKHVSLWGDVYCTSSLLFLAHIADVRDQCSPDQPVLTTGGHLVALRGSGSAEVEIIYFCIHMCSRIHRHKRRPTKMHNFSVFSSSSSSSWWIVGTGNMVHLPCWLDSVLSVFPLSAKKVSQLIFNTKHQWSIHAQKAKKRMARNDAENAVAHLFCIPPLHDHAWMTGTQNLISKNSAG